MRGSQRVLEDAWVPFPVKTRAFGIPAIVSHTDEAPEHQALLALLGSLACVVAPLVDQQGHCHGYLAADKGRAGGPPAPGDDRCLGIIADQACLLLEYERLTREKERMARRDPLTGAATRARMMERLDHLIDLTERTRQPLSLAILDIDHFKRFNDTLGHQAGDRLLIELVEVLQSSTRKSDLVARYGGEEFVVLMPETPPEGAAAKLDRLVHYVAARTFTFGRRGQTLRMTISAGVAGVPGDPDAPASLLGAADSRLLVAKRSGRNRVVGRGVATPEPV
jgi:diguanylate cyclase (GGDEF)-like protein